MSGFGRDLVGLLGPAIEAGRKALRDMEQDDVPAPLRRVAATSGGRLPPPLAKGLLEALDEDEWLRGKALEAWSQGSGPRAVASAAFLQRDPDWWAVVAAALAEVVAADLRTRLGALEREVAKLEERVTAAKQKAAAPVAPQNGATDEEIATLRAKVKSAATERRKETKRLQKQIDALEGERAALEAERNETEQLASDLRNRVRALRRDVAATRGGGEGLSALTRDPLALARTLDALAALAPAPSIELEPGRGSMPGLRPTRSLPGGVAPDRPASIRWLAGREEPFTLIVDGYNVLYLVDPHRWSTGSARRRLNDALVRLRRQARCMPRIVVVYDSAVGGVATPSVPVDGVEVHFAPEGRIADEEVVELAAAAASTGDVYVVSTDRRVRDDAEAVGAVALWSQALIGYLFPGH